MNPQTVLVVTWVLVGLVVAGYIWFVVWRFRVDRRKKAAAEAVESPLRQQLATFGSAPAPSAAPVAPVDPVAPAAPVDPAPAEAAAPAAPAAVAPAPAPPPGDGVATVAAALSGITLPHDLVPLTTMAPRPNVGDRVAFWTGAAPAEVVGPAFADELERLGYTVTPVDLTTLAAVRDDTRLMVVLHPDGPAALLGEGRAFPTVPERAVVVETWLVVV